MDSKRRPNWTRYLNFNAIRPKDFLGSTDGGDDFDEDSGSSMGAISGRGTPATASSPTTAAFNAVFRTEQGRNSMGTNLAFVLP